MQIKRSVLRDKAVVILYQIDIYESRSITFDIDEVIKSNVEVENEFVKNIVYGVTTYKSELDDIANSLIKDWTIDRLDKIGASILRVGLYELKYTDTPEIVVINEAIELAKKYTDSALTGIINAVLDKYIKSWGYNG